MMLKTVLLFPTLFFLGLSARPQCSTLGQAPATAFPVCGVDTFSQHTVPLCVNSSVPAGTCGSYADTNPFWYQFTCFESGTLGFLITPDNANEDYDWELFDITGHNPSDVYTEASLFVVANWCGTYGKTGTSATATNQNQCGSDPAAGLSTFSKMPNIIHGHIYLLLVSHFSPTQSGYKLTFNGGTAVITDPSLPKLVNATATCDALSVNIEISKQVKCSSLSNDGSDFVISTPDNLIDSAVGNSCSAGFDFNYVKLNFKHPLPVGDYVVTIQNGIDGNTLLDDCNNNIPVGSTLHFTVLPIPPPTPFNKVEPVGCAPNILTLPFSKFIHCNSVADDGSDFVITGPVPVNIVGASPVCRFNNNALSIKVFLDRPLVVSGTYTIKLVTGIDGNTIIDECGQETPAGSEVGFTVSDTVSASFNYQLLYGCNDDTVLFLQDARNGINQWNWEFDNNQRSSLQNPQIIYSDFGSKNVQLIVSNGVCADTASATILLDNLLKADFNATDSLCPNDKAIFQSNSIGEIVSWNWDFGDGTNSIDSIPLPHAYPASTNEMKYLAKLIVENNLGCFDTATKRITKIKNCYVDVPSGFTPNGDGNNDYLYPLNAYKATNLEFRIYNRYGQLVFETKDWNKKWDGSINGKLQDTGTYVWMLSYTDKETGKKYFRKGTTVLIR